QDWILYTKLATLLPGNPGGLQQFMKALSAIHRAPLLRALSDLSLSWSPRAQAARNGSPSSSRGGTMTLQLLRKAWVFSVATLFIVAVGTPLAWGQHTEGTVNVTVTDPQGAVVPGADLKFVDVASGDTRAGKTTGGGTYSFPN